MGGRLVALRWVLEADAESLSERARLQKQDLLARYPKYAALAKQAAASGGIELGQVQEQFAMADADGQGALTLAQFRQFTENLQLALNKRESEAIFMKLDKQRVGRVPYEAIQTWWTTQ